MRAFALLVTVVALCVGCCTQPAVAPSRADAVAVLESSTVALVRLGLDISVDAEGIQVEPATKAFCSGVWVSASSFLTAHHCVDELELGAEVAYVTSRDIPTDGRKLFQVKIAKLAAIDADHDLAILRALVPPPHEIAALSVEQIRPGDETQTMGHPLGLWFSYSSGEVAAIREAKLTAGEDDPIKATLWIQTTAPISPGNSGGGLFDSHGHLIGICSRGRRDGQNVNFYVHRNHLAAFLRKQVAA